MGGFVDILGDAKSLQYENDIPADVHMPSVANCVLGTSGNGVMTSVVWLSKAEDRQKVSEDAADQLDRIEPLANRIHQG